MSRRDPNTLRCRIAPSPTGDPHVGTAYMALFNRALADSKNGNFIFRLDDTDRNRYQASSEKQLYEALEWLGIKIDEAPHLGGPHAPYRQSERLEIYKGYIQKLLDENKAYYCFATPEELEVMRKIQQREGRSPMYDRRWRDRSEADVQAMFDQGKTPVVRIKMPLEGEVLFEDVLRGPIRFAATELDDKVILKADGFPTYHLANVVDDHEFGITHIIRGEEWLSSVPLHIVLMEALSFQRPVFIHMPLLRNADRSKVSKRKNPTSLLWFKDAGFIPEGMLNFLGLMGFSLPNDQELFTYQEFVQHFNPERISKAGPIFDLQKLEWCNGEHIRKLEDQDLFNRISQHLKVLAGREDDFQMPPEDDPIHQKGQFADNFRLKTILRNHTIAGKAEAWLHDSERLEKLIPLIKERIHTLSEAGEYLPPFFEELPELPLEELASLKKTTKEEVLEIFQSVLELFEQADFSPSGVKELEEKIRNTLSEKSWKAKTVFMSLRLAILRSKVSPPLFESFAVLGKERSLKRLSNAIEQWQKQ